VRPAEGVLKAGVVPATPPGGSLGSPGGYEPAETPSSRTSRPRPSGPPWRPSISQGDRPRSRAERRPGVFGTQAATRALGPGGPNSKPSGCPRPCPPPVYLRRPPVPGSRPRPSLGRCPPCRFPPEHRRRSPVPTHRHLAPGPQEAPPVCGCRPTADRAWQTTRPGRPGPHRIQQTPPLMGCPFGCEGGVGPNEVLAQAGENRAILGVFYPTGSLSPSWGDDLTHPRL